MTSRSWLVPTIGFATLLLLIGLLGFGAIRQSRALHRETLAAHDAYMQTDSVLRTIPADLYLGDVLIRDYLLDPSHLLAPSYREQLRTRRSSIRQELNLLSQRLGLGEPTRIQKLRTELRLYWDSMDPILRWSPAEKAALGGVFLRQQVLPRREAIIALSREISEINAANWRKEQQRLEGSQKEFQAFLRRTLLIALSLGLLVALVSTARVAYLERRSEQQRGRAEHAEEELRRLSRNLVRTQEEERRSLSRELHDAVGQMLSAMTMELGNMESSIHSPEKVRARIEEARRLNAETMRGVRDLAMGLRPSMLDELGLAPALRWQGREFSRRSGVPVTVQIDGDLEGLPEPHRTCMYRIVQEALTNCARHAEAKNIRISIYGCPDWVQLSIQDDGVGFDPQNASSRGLGLIGIQERAGELDGKVTIISQPQKGTILEVEVPIARGVGAA
ncbi:MAG: sensor histidine kinase [Acidobacteria bacterium]|nr:sensor histidine kinase [Acidobacteriota bacterium]